MTLRLLTAAALVAAVTTFTSPAAASPPGPNDVGCGFASTNDVNPEAPPDQQTGEIDGGPIAQSGTLVCTIQVGANRLHVDSDNGAIASAPGTGVTLLPPVLVSYSAPANANVWLCDRFTDAAGASFVYDADESAWESAAGNTTAACRLAITVGTDDPILDTAHDAVDRAYDLARFACSVAQTSQCPPYMCDLGLLCIDNGQVYVLPRT